MDKKKLKLHERLLDSEHAMLISDNKNSVSVDFINDPLLMGGKMNYLFTQEIDLARLFLSSIAAAAVTCIKKGDTETANELRDAIHGTILYVEEAFRGIQN